MKIAIRLASVFRPSVAQVRPSMTVSRLLPHATGHAHRGQTEGAAHLEMAGGSGGTF